MLRSFPSDVQKIIPRCVLFFSSQKRNILRPACRSLSRGKHKFSFCTDLLVVIGGLLESFKIEKGEAASGDSES